LKFTKKNKKIVKNHLILMKTCVILLTSSETVRLYQSFLANLTKGIESYEKLLLRSRILLLLLFLFYEEKVSFAAKKSFE